MQTLKEILNSAKTSLAYGILYLPSNKKWDLETKGLIIDIDNLDCSEVDEEDEPLIAKKHNLKETIESACIEDIVSFSNGVKPNPSDEFLLESFLYYFKNDGFLQ